MIDKMIKVENDVGTGTKKRLTVWERNLSKMKHMYIDCRTST